MALEDIINNKLRLTPNRVPSKNIFKKLIKLIKNGSIDRRNPHHRVMISMGVRDGYIDEDLNILKEA